MPLGNWQAFGSFLEFAVRRGAVKGLPLKVSPTSRERQLKALHRAYMGCLGRSQVGPLHSLKKVVH